MEVRFSVERWEVMLKDHHDAYIEWAEFERNQTQLALPTVKWTV